MTDPDPIPTKSVLARSVHRILVEALVVALIGATVFGIFWELQLRDAGLIVAGIIWIAGAPLLELLRLRRSRR